MWGKTMLEVSNAGRVRYDGKMCKLEKHRKRTRVWYRGKRYDVIKLMRRVIYGPSGKPDWSPTARAYGYGWTPPLKWELWFDVSKMMLSDVEN